MVENLPTDAGDKGQSLIREHLTCHGAIKRAHHNCSACALEPGSHYCSPCAQSPAPREATSAREEPLHSAARETPSSNGDLAQQKLEPTAKKQGPRTILHNACLSPEPIIPEGHWQESLQIKGQGLYTNFIFAPLCNPTKTTAKKRFSRHTPIKTKGTAKNRRSKVLKLESKYTSGQWPHGVLNWLQRKLRSNMTSTT